MTRFALACQIQLATATQPQRPDVRRPGLTVCAALLVVAGVSTGAWAEGATGAAAVVTRTADEPLPLRPSALLTDRLVPDAQAGAPSFVWGDAISGTPGERTLIDGHAELRRHDTILKADRLELWHKTDEATATGNVSVLRNGNRFTGPELKLNIDTYEGFFTAPHYELMQSNGRGDASRVDFKGENLTVAHNATYTTCLAPMGMMPDWWIKAVGLELDHANDTGRAASGALYFKGVPILAAPYVSFPLSDKRKSGLLPPAINLTNLSGLELTLPYYWNIAPEFDATLSPTLMTKRGINLNGEFRYLQPTFKGEVKASVMPDDRLRTRQRWSHTLLHQHALGDALPGFSGSGLRFNLNRVSDNDYWRDFPRSGATLTQRLLPNEMAVSGNIGAVGVTAGVYTWQTLQDTAAPIVAPYDRQPQIDVRWEQLNQRVGAVDGLDYSLTGQLTRFTTRRTQSVTPVLADINGNRLLGIAQISRHWQAPGWFIKPKAQLHISQYNFDQALYTGARSASRVVPTFSLDSGLVFERDATVLGRGLLQTLEPRALYVRMPYRDQNSLPNYDSAAKDFNVGSAWTENVFGGNDRISDTHAVTVGVGSRLIDPDTGVEAARFSLAQRFRFADQNVVLPGGTAVTDRLSDVLLGAALNWDPKWAFESSVQFNPKQGRSQRTTLGGRYHPQPFHVLSGAYRLQRAGGLLPPSEQVDVGWQWPLHIGRPGAYGAQASGSSGGCSGNWYSVGRINYSVPDRKVVDLIAGFEYDAGCWIGRVVLERLQRSTASSSQRVMFQLEFTGFTRIGSNPLQTLKNNVPKYMTLNEQVQTPSRFGRYE
jgi:LPS-assembly protein